MVDFFKKSGLGQLVAIMLLTVLLWVHSFVNPPALEVSPYDGMLYEWIVGLLGGLPRLAVAIALLLTLAAAAWLNLLVASNKLLPNNSFLPALCFVLVSSFGIEGKTLTDLLLVNLVVVYVAAQFMTGAQPILSRVKMCNAVTAISLASLVYVPAIFLLVPFMVQFFVFRMYHWKDLAAMLLGLAAPYVLVLAVAYLGDSWGGLWWQTGGRLHIASFAIEGCSVWSTWLYIVVLLLVVVSLLKCSSFTGEQTAAYKRNAGAYLLPLLASVAIVIYQGLWPLPPAALAVPVAFAASVVLCNIKKRKWIADVGMALMIVVSIVIEFV